MITADQNFVSIIIPTLNEGDNIGILIRKLMSDSFQNKEIIVVDGGSTDGTSDIARGAGATVVEETNTKCPANARNQGAEASHGDVLCFLDADNDVNEGFISNAIKNFANPDVVAVRSQIRDQRHTWVQRTLASIRNSPPPKIVEQGIAFTFMRREVFEMIGGYPLVGYEDVLLAHKLRIYLKENPTKNVIFESTSIIFKGLPASVEEHLVTSAWRGRTIISYLNESELSLLRKLILLTLPIIYLVSIASVFLSVFSKWFLILAIPYMAKMLVVILNTIKIRDKYRLLTPIIDFISSVGYLIGLLQYILGKGKLSRGHGGRRK